MKHFEGFKNFLNDPDNNDYNDLVSQNRKWYKTYYHYGYFRIFLTGSGVNTEDSYILKLKFLKNIKII